MKAKFIYNPKAGSKKSFLFRKKPSLMLEDLHRLLRKYEIEFDETPTKGPGDARRLAAEAAKEGRDLVIIAGGDGTVGEAANGLVGTDTALGILPLGTFMNVARMLSIPFALEAAVQTIKMGNVRRIDVGEIVYLEGKGSEESRFFLEEAGMGFEALFQEEFLAWERGDRGALIRFFKNAFGFYSSQVTVELDEGKSFESRAHVITISNGPYAGAALPLAPSAKLNDHLLTVRRYRMSRGEFVRHLLRIKTLGVYQNPQIEVYKSATVKITSPRPRSVHADARVFGTTPVSFKVRPSALNVITGFPDSPEDSALLKERTYLAP